MKTLSNNKHKSIDLAEHICLLEKRLKSQKIFLWLFAIGLLTVLALGATSQDANVIRTKKLQVVNDAGAVVAELSANKNGGSLQIANTKGRDVLRLDADNLGGAVQTFHNDGRKGVSLHQYVIADIEKPLTGGMVEVFDHKGESVVALGSGIDTNFAVSMGAGYDGGAVVVYRNGAPIHFARPQVNVFNNPVPLDLNGMRFISIGKHEGGLGPNGVINRYWSIRFKDGLALWDYSDVRSAGKFTVDEDGMIKAKMGSNYEVEGFFDKANKRLFWAGKWYRLFEK